MGSETNNPPESIWVTWPKSPDEVYREQYRKWYCIPDGVHQGTWSNEKPEEDGVEYRRVDPTDDSRGLRRALEIASSQLLEAMHAMMERKSPKPSADDVKHYIDSCISRAVGELESEVRDGLERTDSPQG